jgi:hypothetical protein
VKTYVAFTCWVLALAPTWVAASESQPIKLELCDGRPVVDGVYVNGHGPYRFLVDTGSTLNHLEPKLARAIGLAVTFHTTLTSSTGRTDAEGTESADIRLGPSSADQQVFLLSGIDALHEIAPNIQGVLGQIFLSRFNYRLDLRSKRLEFSESPEGETGERLPFHLVEGRPVVSTSLGSLVLDSGAHYLVLFGVRASESTHQIVTSTGSLDVGTIFRRLTINGRAFWRGDAIAVPQSPEAGVEGLLPVSPFTSIFVNNSERYVVFN